MTLKKSLSAMGLAGLKSARQNQIKGFYGTAEEAAEKVRKADPSRPEARSG
jgi:hypothetical protein